MARNAPDRTSPGAARSATLIRPGSTHSILVEPSGVNTAGTTRRRRIWDLGESLHCSIIGTCLTTDEIRRLLRKIRLGPPDATDHALHGFAVCLANRQDVGSKLLNKALDDRHRTAIRRFDAARDIGSLRALWRAATDAGDVPGAYWAVLTHPAADQTLITEAFGHVHMLSHLVGASNRADIRRLALQEHEIASLRDTVERQQRRLRDEITERDARIRHLQDLLATRTIREVEASPATADETERLITDLRRRLAIQEDRVRTAEDRRRTLESDLATERGRTADLTDEVNGLRCEIAIAEAVIGHEDPAAGISVRDPSIPGTVLYVGGRSGQTQALRQAAARIGIELLHHDAAQGAALLPGLVGRADLVVFPVDCVSHESALAVKRLCRQLGRPFRPLRSTGTSSLLAALLSKPASVFLAPTVGEAMAKPLALTNFTPPANRPPFPSRKSAP